MNATVEKALIDPRRVFVTPENLVSDNRLNRVEKLQILHKWREDAEALSIAANEGMTGDGPAMLQRVQLAINQLMDGNRR